MVVAEVKLTPKQKAFADYYIQCGNAAEAARKAKYSPKTADVIGRENLRKPAISQYISERMEKQDTKRVADANEVIEFYTSVMRGQVKDQFGLEASLSDRLKAGDSLMRRYAVSADKNKVALEKLDRYLEEVKKYATERRISE